MTKGYKKAELTFEALYKAYLDCRKHKSSTVQAMKFEYEREKNLVELYNDIVSGNYEIGKSICFIVKEPKFREVWAGAFRDRIVHHLIYNAIFDRFVSKFIYDSYSCIPNKGTLPGAKRAERFARNLTQNYSKKAYFVKMDIKNYFVSIDKEILFNLIVKYVDEPWLVDLIKKVVFHDPRKNVYIKSPQWMRDRLPEYKSLFNVDSQKGLPIGNLTSQFFSNIYLNPVDQYAKHVLKCKYYLRYVDDILILDSDSGYLNYAYAKINRFLIDNLKLELNHRKKNINTISKGFDFLGHVIKPNRIHLRERTVKKCYRLIKDWENSPNRFSQEELEKIKSSVNSYLGMLRHVNGFKMRKDISNRINNLFIMPDKQYSKLTVVKNLDLRVYALKGAYSKIQKTSK